MRVKSLLVLLAFTAMAAALLSGPVGFGLGEPQSAEAAFLTEIKKLLASDAQSGDLFGYTVAVSGDTAVAGGYGVSAAYVFQRNQGGTDNWGQVKKLTASDGPGNQFAWSAAISGDTAVVGAYLVNAGATGGSIQLDIIDGKMDVDQSGAITAADDLADVLLPLSGGGSDQVDIIDGEVDVDQSGAVTAADDLATLVLYYAGTYAGAAYIFQRNEGGADNWGEVKKLTASDAQAFDWFGYSVAVSGDTTIIGTRFEDTGGKGAGAAYVFRRDEGGADNWGHVKKLTASDAGADDQFGFSVAVSGDTAVVGALNEDTGGSDAGAAYLFQRNQGGADNWGELKKLTASGPQSVDLFGISVAVSGDTTVIGANGDDAADSGAGAAYVFQRDQGGADNWGEVTKLTASDAQAGDQFGRGVAVSGDTAVVGAYLEDAGSSIDDNFGAAYVFQRNEGGADNWGELKKLTASDAEADDLFGFSVAISGGTTVVGAYTEDAGGNVAGAAYVFQDPALAPTNTPTATPTPTITPTPTPTPDLTDTDGDGCPDQKENGLDKTLGGQRDYLDPWDFYDVAGLSGATPDGYIDLLFDVLGVIQHYSPQGDPPYDVWYDRGPSQGPNAWNMTEPDGVIDLLNDILGVIQQYSHDCR